MKSLQRALHKLLAPEAWRGPGGLSPVNRALCIMILVSSALAVLETEDTIVAAAPWLFDVAEVTFALLFGAEYVARVYAAGADPRYAGVGGRLRYLVTPMALIDLAAIAPLYIGYVSNDPVLLRLCRLLRILRLAKLGRYSTALQHIDDAIMARKHELVLSLVLTGTILMVSASLIYVFESEGQPQQFGSIPRALWWAVVTLTTVGYGDVYPLTVPGRILAGFTALAGVAMIAVPTGILAAAFSDVFQRQRAAQDAARHQPNPNAD
jgi:voltage-gated potassium channel